MILARAFLCFVFLTGTVHAQTYLAIGAVVAKRVHLSLQGDRLEVRSNSREGVMLTVGTTTIVVPGGVQFVDLRALRPAPDAPLRITASPL